MTIFNQFVGSCLGLLGGTMNRQRYLLDLARPARLSQHGAARPMLVLTAALVIGLPSARPFADAIGLPQITNMRAEWMFVALRALCGVVAISAAAAVASLVLRGVQWLHVTLASVSSRPPLPVALSLVTAGPLCMLASLLLPMYMGQLAVSGEEASVRVPLLASLLAVMTFLAGAVLVGVGLWASIRPHSADMMNNRPAVATELDKSIFNVLHARSPHIEDEGLGFGEIQMQEARR
jgi:hypothetical protein